MSRRRARRTLAVLLPIAALLSCSPAADKADAPTASTATAPVVHLGPRPLYLLDDMDESPLKRELEDCRDQQPLRSDFSIGHRGAPLQFPEHTRESYLAAARMGAGLIECDVTFTRDAELVCRHAQCDLHLTTNILEIPDLAKHCSQGFESATFDASGRLVKPASAKCCTSDLTLAQFRQLEGRMEGANPRATTVAAYHDGTPSWRTDLYSNGGTLLTHRESIDLIRAQGSRFVPELKGVDAEVGFGASGLTRDSYAQKLIDEYRDAGVPPADVWPQSFDLRDIQYWLDNEPAFGRQAVYLDGRYEAGGFDHRRPATWDPDMAELAASGVNILAPPLWMLLEAGDGRIRPSLYARAARDAGLDLVAWTLERSGPLGTGGGWYYQTVAGAVNNDGDMLTVLDALARDVGVIGVFSDWPATTTWYANCVGPGAPGTQ